MGVVAFAGFLLELFLLGGWTKVNIIEIRLKLLPTGNLERFSNIAFVAKYLVRVFASR